MACGLGAAPLGERTRKLHTSYLGSTTFLIEHPQKKQIVNTPSLSLAHARFISLVGPWLLTHTSWDKAGDSAAFGLRQHGSRLQGCIPECVILAGSLHSVYSGCFNGNLFGRHSGGMLCPPGGRCTTARTVLRAHARSSRLFCLASRLEQVRAFCHFAMRSTTELTVSHAALCCV